MSESSYTGYFSGTEGSVSSIELLMEDVNWPPEYAPLREAILRLITHERLFSRRLTAEELVTPLNSLGGVDGSDDVHPVDEKLIKTAFSKCSKSEFCIEDLDDLGIEGLPNNKTEDNPDGHAFHARVGHRCGSYRRNERTPRITDFGIHKHGMRALMDIEDSYKNPPVAEISWRPILQDLNISNELKASLNKFLKEKHADKVRRARTKGSSKKKKKSGSGGKSAKAKKQKTMAEEEREDLALKSAALKKKESELSEQYTAVAAELAAVRTEIKVNAGEEKRKQMNTSNTSDNAKVKHDISNTLYYVHNARAGSVQMDETGVILKEEIENGLVDLPHDIDNEVSEKTRARTNYTFATHGASTSWVPNTHKLSVKNRQEETKSEHDIMTKIKSLFSKDISTWSHEAQRIIIASSMFGYGCSDEGTIMIMAGTLKALFIEAGIDIDEVQIAKALFSRATLAEMEARCATDCVLGRCQEMKEDKIKSDAVFDKWMGTKWRKSSILHYMLAGDPVHAKAFAQYLVHYKEVVLPQFENEDVEEDFVPEPFVFPNEDVILGLHHQTQDLEAHHTMHGSYSLTVNLRESMEYILSEANREEIIKDPFVVENWTLIKSLAKSDTVVELFSKTSASELDRSTWGTVDYRRLRKAMWKRICIHSNHQQRCENMIQLSGLLSKTGVGEVRRSIRAIIVSATIRRFNQWALAEKNKMNAEMGKPPVTRLQGSDKTALWLRFLRKYVFPPADKARKFLEDKAKSAEPGSSTITHKDICDRLKKKEKKVSAKEIDEKIEHWHGTLESEKLSKEVKAEQAAGIEKTGRVSEAVYLRILTVTNSSYLDGDETMSDIADAEIKARGIKVKKKKVSKNMLESMTIFEKRKLLREDELKVRIDEELKLADIKYIVPQSEEMKRIRTDGTQQRILDKADGIDRIEDSL